MEIVAEQPPNIDRILERFPALEEHRDRVVFAYGSKIYNPSGKPIPSHLIIHEGVHAKQQGDDIDAWWDKYLEHNDFRQEMEIDAYAHQYRFVKDAYGSKNSDKLLVSLAKDLSSPLYDLDLTYAQAEKAIKAKAKLVLSFKRPHEQDL